MSGSLPPQAAAEAPFFTLHSPEIATMQRMDEYQRVARFAVLAWAGITILVALVIAVAG